MFPSVRWGLAEQGDSENQYSTILEGSGTLPRLRGSQLFMFPTMCTALSWGGRGREGTAVMWEQKVQTGAGRQMPGRDAGVRPGGPRALGQRESRFQEVP